MIDTHHHLLPGIDDGSKSLAMSIEMARVSIQSGVTDVVVTPHHGNGVFETFKLEVVKATAGLQRAFEQAGIDLNLHVGSELHFTPELITQLKNDQVLTYADKGSAVLLELPKQRLPMGLKVAANEFKLLGLQAVLAHPERNSDLLNAPEKLAELSSYGYKGQLTALSVTGAFGKPIKNVSDQWIKEGLIHTVASDAHRPRGRSPALHEAYEEVVRQHGDLMAKTLFLDNPRCLLEGKPLIETRGLSNYRSPGFLRQLFG